MSRTQIFVCVLFGLTTFIAICTSFATSGQRTLEMQVSFQAIPVVLGIFIACAASLSLLLRAIAGDSVAKMTPMLIPLFAGLLLIDVHWFVALPLALIVLAIVLRETIERVTAGDSDQSVRAE